MGLRLCRAVLASGSGKYTPYPEQKWNNNLAQDWNNGSIAGVKADVKLNADIKRETTNTPVNVNAKQNNLVVNGNSESTLGSREKSKHQSYRSFTYQCRRDG
ncbi:hypothetical protein F9860_10105 [Glaesserella parasuis]|nr:hypothetical protein [Glaesserella parasuis]